MRISNTAYIDRPRVRALVDEGGVRFWIPGFFGSLAAAPQQPGWSLATINYYTNVSAGGNVALAREFEIRNLPANIQAQINASLHVPACDSHDGWTAIGIKPRRQDVDCDFADQGPIVALSHAVVAALSWAKRRGISLESQEYFEQLEIVFVPL